MKIPQNRNLLAGLLLIGGIGVSATAARVLERLARIPSRPALFYTAFMATVLASYLAGRLADVPRQSPVTAEPAPPLPRWARIVSLALAYVCLLLFLWSWLMRPRWDAPLKIVMAWAGSLASGAAAFAFAGARASTPRGRRLSAWPWLLLLPILLAAAAARLIALDRIPPTFSGDEAGQVQDGLAVIHGSPRSDPFGTGWTSSMHLGLLPAGWGATLGPAPIAGPRRPYAIAGTLSVVVCTFAAGMLAGGWSALGCAALLAFSPHHVHFSRIASHMVLDSLLAGLTVISLFAVYRSRHPLWSYLAGLSSGLSLYGYAGGRQLTITFLILLPIVVFRPGRSRSERALLSLAAMMGFLLTAGPNLRFAVEHPDDWNARFNQVGIFSPNWWNASVALLGSPAKVLENQFVEGTIGLLSEYTSWPWYQGYPIVAPILLPALALSGFGWLVGRRQFFDAAVLTLVALGNLAGIILSAGAPAPQRPSSLMPILAISGGVAIAAILGLIPPQTSGGTRWREIAGTAAIAGLLLWTCRLPGVWDPSPGYGGPSAAFVTSAYGLLRMPRYSRASIVLHGAPNASSSFPGIAYLLPDIRWTDARKGDEDGTAPASGLHLFSPDYLPSALEWKRRFHLRFVVHIADPGNQVRDLGYLLFVPRQPRPAQDASKAH